MDSFSIIELELIKRYVDDELDHRHSTMYSIFSRVENTAQVIFEVQAIIPADGSRGIERNPETLFVTSHEYISCSEIFKSLQEG